MSQKNCLSGGIFVTNGFFFLKKNYSPFQKKLKKLCQPLFHEAQCIENLHCNPANYDGCMCTIKDSIWAVNFAMFMSSWILSSYRSSLSSTSASPSYHNRRTLFTEERQVPKSLLLSAGLQPDRLYPGENDAIGAKWGCQDVALRTPTTLKVGKYSWKASCSEVLTLMIFITFVLLSLLTWKGKGRAVHVRV